MARALDIHKCIYIIYNTYTLCVKGVGELGKLQHIECIAYTYLYIYIYICITL